MKVVIAIDSSDASKYVVDEAVARPWPKGTLFSVVNVIDVFQFARLPALVEDAKREGAALVKAATQKLAKTGHTTNNEVILGNPRTAISEHAKQCGADLVMVGSRSCGQARQGHHHRRSRVRLATEVQSLEGLGY